MMQFPYSNSTKLKLQILMTYELNWILAFIRIFLKFKFNMK